MGKLQKRDENAGLINLIIEIIENEELHGGSSYENEGSMGAISVHSDGYVALVELSVSAVNPLAHCYSFHQTILYEYSNNNEPFNHPISTTSFSGCYELCKEVLLNHIENKNGIFKYQGFQKESK